MNKKIKYSFFMLITFFIMTLNVSAASCSSEELSILNEKANNIVNTVDLREFDDESHEESELETYISYIISFYNMEENLKLVQVGGSYVSSPSHIVDGRISFPMYYLDYTVEKFNVYSGTDTCSGELLRTIEVIIPQYNELSRNAACREEKLKDFYYCRKVFTTPTNISYDDFLKEVDKYKKELQSSLDKEEGKVTDIGTFFNKYWMWILIAVVVVAVGVYITLRIKRNKEIKKRGVV